MDAPKKKVQRGMALVKSGPPMSSLSKPGQAAVSYAQPGSPSKVTQRLRPAACVRIAENIPLELQSRDQFVAWRYEQNGGRRTKILYDAKTGRRASSTNSATWCNPTIALEAFLRYGQYDGIGFVFSANDPYCGIDLDHCVDKGVVSPAAQHVVDAVDSYTELSPSGNGIHIIARGKLPPGRRREGWVEMYDSGRYFTVTGERLESTPADVTDRQAQILELHTRIFPAPVRQRVQRAPAAQMPQEELFDHILASFDGHRFKQLWGGHWEELGYDSQSQADLALIGLLSKWVGGSAAQLDDLFRGSGLFRDKWDEQRGELTYGDRTIARALGELS